MNDWEDDVPWDRSGYDGPDGWGRSKYEAEPDEGDGDEDATGEDDADAAETLPCPACGTDVYEDADICPVCGEAILRHRPATAGLPGWFAYAGLVGMAGVILTLLFGGL